MPSAIIRFAVNEFGQLWFEFLMILEAAECSESMEIDICGETLDDTPSKKYVVREEMPADVQWVYDEAKKV